MAGEDEVNTFLAEHLSDFVGECSRRDGTSWCTWHLSRWYTTEKMCDKAADYDDFAFKVIEAWESRG